MRKIQKKLGDILMGKGLINAEQLEEAIKEQGETREFLGAILLKKGLVKEGDLLQALSEQFNIPLVSLKDKYIDWDIVKKFRPSLILDYRCFPLKRDDWSVTMAITDPLDVWVIKRAEEAAAGFELKLALVSIQDMNEAIGRYRQYLHGDIQKKFK